MSEELPAQSGQAGWRQGLSRAIDTQVRVLALMAGRQELDGLDRWHLLLGLTLTWAVGIGRSWDDPTAPLWLKSGLPSVAYVFALSTFLWLAVMPLGPKDWRWSKVVTFVSLTAPPGLVYAIPVERFMLPVDAVEMNLVFLMCVAAWRIAMLASFVARTGALGLAGTPVAILFPLEIIAVAILVMQVRTFDIMAGMAGVRFDDWQALRRDEFFQERPSRDELAWKDSRQELARQEMADLRQEDEERRYLVARAARTIEPVVLAAFFPLLIWYVIAICARVVARAVKRAPPPA